MQIINLSLGDLPSFRSDPLAAAAENAALKGVAVIGAAGNSGEEVRLPIH
jgi:subtilisin family serine protease